jgi:hypothetical protein
VVEAVSEEKARQIEVDYHRTAWLAMHIMNTQGRTLKRPVTVEKLLGRDKKKNRKLTTEQREKTINDLLKKFEDSEK